MSRGPLSSYTCRFTILVNSVSNSEYPRYQQYLRYAREYVWFPESIARRVAMQSPVPLRKVCDVDAFPTARCVFFHV